MVHWSICIVAFLLGFAFCYYSLYELTKIEGKILNGIEKASKEV